jgi:hypothetical protein
MIPFPPPQHLTQDKVFDQMTSLSLFVVGGGYLITEFASDYLPMASAEWHLRSLLGSPIFPQEGKDQSRLFTAFHN